jgi:hypothetical protein
MLFIALWGLLALQFPHTEAASTQFDRIHARIEVESVRPTSTEIAGFYVNPPNELAEKSDSSVLRSNLYLFPDQTYVYVERSSIVPATIFDKGRWVVASGLLQLQSDTEIKWNPDLERSFLMLQRASHSSEILLVGSGKAVDRFEARAVGNPETALLSVAKQRIKAISPEQTARVRGDLMKRAWHPDRFTGTTARIGPQKSSM